MAVKVERRALGGDLSPNIKDPAKELGTQNGKSVATKDGLVQQALKLDAAVYAVKSNKAETQAQIKDPTEAKVVAKEVSEDIRDNEEQGVQAHQEIERVNAKQHLIN